MDMARKSGAPIGSHEDLDDCAKIMTQSKPPSAVEYRKEGKFVRVINREWRANE